jgi:hypothetical protein
LLIDRACVALRCLDVAVSQQLSKRPDGLIDGWRLFFLSPNCRLPGAQRFAVLFAQFTIALQIVQWNERSETLCPPKFTVLSRPVGRARRGQADVFHL